MAESVVPVPVDEALDLLDVLISYDTVALTPNLDLIDDVRDRLETLGASVVLTYDDSSTKANLFATIGPNVNGGVVLSGHSDVVPVDPADWTTPPFTADHRHGRVYGRGTADMKGFVACVLAMAPTYAELDLTVPIHVALTFDEEDGFHGAPILLADLVERGVRPSAAIIGEPTGLRTVGAHKGCYEYRTMVTGINGHSSAPAEAVSAVHHASRWISGLLGLADDLVDRAPNPSPYDPPSTTFNVGTISGGQGRCVVADRCWFDWEMRPVQASDASFVKEHMAAVEAALLDEMRAVHPEASIQTDVVCEIDGLEWRDASPALDLVRVLLADEVAANGGTLPVDVVAYGTEAGLFQAAGIPAVLWGPGDISVAHRPDEFVEVADLDVCLALLARLGGHLAR
ncbi:MAG: acetylornithine deacetylase [Actinomycetota bacterium]|nr:acetylornithine deacetylase [Actinomycetota bacterium]MEC9449510.1 acetylornithine deacetylase [Actinomycetota bacterium]MED5165782.1 acetylornithine deacetylase [Actinomycetota bacterium]MEE3205962.1 acetylornithine deacetylase [Actinomycetota bacterium]